MARFSLGQINVPVDGSPAVPLDLPNSQFLRSLTFRVTANVTNAAGPTIHEDALSRALRFRIYHGTDPILDLRGDRLRHFFGVWHGIAQDYTEIPAIVGAQVGTWNFTLPSSDPRLVTNPDATLSDMALSTNPRIELQAGGGYASISPDAGTLDSLTVDVSAEVSLRPPGFPRIRTLPLRRWRETLITDLQASTADQPRRLKFGHLVRAYMFQVKDQAASPARTDALVQSLELSPNLFNGGRSNFTDLRTETRERFGIVPPTGIAFADFDPSRSLQSRTMLDLRGAREMLVNVETNAAPNGVELVVVEEQILKPDKRAVAAVAQQLRKGRAGRRRARR